MQELQQSISSPPPTPSHNHRHSIFLQLLPPNINLSSKSRQAETQKAALMLKKQQFETTHKGQSTTLPKSITIKKKFSKRNNSNSTTTSENQTESSPRLSHNHLPQSNNLIRDSSDDLTAPQLFLPPQLPTSTLSGGVEITDRSLPRSFHYYNHDESLHLSKLLRSMLDRTLRSKQQTPFSTDATGDVNELLTSIIEEADPTLTVKIRRSLLDLCKRGLDLTTNKQCWSFARAFIKHAQPIDLLELGPFLLDCSIRDVSTNNDDDSDVPTTLFLTTLWTCLQKFLTQTIAAATAATISATKSNPVLNVPRLTALGACAWWPLQTNAEPALGEHRAHIVGEVRFFPGPPNKPLRITNLTTASTKSMPSVATTGAWFSSSSFLAIPYSPALNLPEFSIEIQIKVKSNTISSMSESVFLSSRVVPNIPNDPPKGWEIDVRKSSSPSELIFTFRAGEDKVFARLHNNASNSSSGSTSSSSLDDWVHVLCCRSNQRLTIVLNHGEVVRSTPIPSPNISANNTTISRPYKPNTDAPLYVGSTPPSSTMGNRSSRFEGYLANLVVYNSYIYSNPTDSNMPESSPNLLPTALRPTSSPRSSPTVRHHVSTIVTTTIPWSGQIVTARDALLYIISTLCKADDKLLVLSGKWGLDALLTMFEKVEELPEQTIHYYEEIKMTLMDLLQRTMFVLDVDDEGEEASDDHGYLKALLALSKRKGVGGRVLERVFASGVIKSAHVITAVLLELIKEPILNETALKAGQWCLCMSEEEETRSKQIWVNELFKKLGNELIQQQQQVDRIGVLIELVNDCCIMNFVESSGLTVTLENEGVMALFSQLGNFMVKQQGEIHGEENNILIIAMKELIWNLVFCCTEMLLTLNEKQATPIVVMENDIVQFLQQSNPVDSSDDIIPNNSSLFESIKIKFPLPLVHRARFAGKVGEGFVWKALERTFTAVMVLSNNNVDAESVWKSTWSILPSITARRQQQLLGITTAGNGDALSQIQEICESIEFACDFLLSRKFTATSDKQTGTGSSIVVSFIQACLCEPLLLQQVKQQTDREIHELLHASLILQWIESLFKPSVTTLVVQSVQEYVFDLACNAPVKSLSICGPKMVSQYELVRKNAVFTSLQTFLTRKEPPLSLVLKIALKCDLIESNGEASDLIFDLCSGLFVGDFKNTMAATPISFLLLPKTSGYQWSRNDSQTVSEDGLMVSTSNSTRLTKWQQPQFHVGTHGMMSGMFYVELAPIVGKNDDGFIVLAIGVTSRPETEMIDVGCRITLSSDDGVGMLLDLNKGMLSLYWVSSSLVQSTRATRRIALGEEMLMGCEVPSTRPLYFCMVLLSDNCAVKSVFAENAEEQVVVVGNGRGIIQQSQSQVIQQQQVQQGLGSGDNVPGGGDGDGDDGDNSPVE